MTSISEAADLFVTLRQNHRLVAALPESCRPHGASDAYAMQEALVDRLLLQHGGRRLGYKVACTNPYAQQLLQVEAPFYGQLLSAWSFPAPVRLPAASFVHRLIEPEFAFVISIDVPVSSTPYTAASIVPYLSALLPAIEIVDWRYTDWAAVGAPSLIADNAIHGAWVPGPPAPAWQTLDLATHDVRLMVNGTLISQGSGANVLGHPLHVMAWLANELPRWGKGLKAGDRVTTGVCTEVYDAKPGDTIRADFGVLGTVELGFD